MIGKIIFKAIRELYRLFHPTLWRKHFQINGIPHIYSSNNLKLGNYVSVNQGCVLQCYGGVTIGDRVTISDGAKIITRSLDTENYLQNSKKDERDHIDRSVSIGDGVWIATNAIILPGVKISNNSVIAAGAIVTKDIVEEGCIYGGIPARKIREL